MADPAADEPNSVRAPQAEAPPAGGAKIHELPVAKTTGDRAAPARVAPANANETAPPAPRGSRPGLRRMLLLLGPLLLLAGGLGAYLLGGRTVSTDNAYVKADKLNIAPEVAGSVASIAVQENALVKRGQLLFAIEDEPYRIALAGAEAQLAAARTEIATLQATYRQNAAQIEQAKIDVGFYETAFQRQQDLNRRGVATQSSFDQAKHDLDAARERVVVAQRTAEAMLAQLGGKADGDIAEHPRVRQAQAQVDRAARDLRRTRILAPMDGVVANVSSLQVGQYLNAAQAAMSLIGTSDVWIDANPKETDLAAVRPGAGARVTIDAYPGREWRATVASISPATGAEFSVLPPQNASGNWIKVVQRVTVRLHVDNPNDGPQLRSGMSANVEIDTGERRSLSGLLASIRHSVGL